MKRIIIITAVCMLLLSLLSVPALAATKVSGSTLSLTGTSLDDFDFTIDGDTLKFDRYKGTDEDVFIEASYQLNGKTYKTDVSKFMIGIGNKDAKSVFFSEGIEVIYKPVFNSCDVYKFYFPKSLKYLDPDVLSYFTYRKPKPIKLYYAGTQEEFENLLLEGIKVTGKATDTENINVFIGFGFNAADFDFIFEATRDDYTSGEYD